LNPRSGKTRSPDSGLLRQQVYERLRDDIVSGKLAAGTVLSPVALASELDVSVMPVREALRLLDENGLLEVEPRRWTKVAGPDPSVAASVYPLLSVLAEYAMLSAPPPSADLIQEAIDANEELAEALARRDISDCLLADDRFHEAIFALNPNPELRKITRDLKLRIHIVEAAYFRFENSERTVEQHQEIIEALQAGDMKKASELLATYWKQGLGENEKAIFADWSMVRFAS
jgi:DNA-binding GntR family transcriptional regulator